MMVTFPSNTLYDKSRYTTEVSFPKELEITPSKLFTRSLRNSNLAKPYKQLGIVGPKLFPDIKGYLRAVMFQRPHGIGP